MCHAATYLACYSLLLIRHGGQLSCVRRVAATALTYVCQHSVANFCLHLIMFLSAVIAVSISALLFAIAQHSYIHLIVSCCVCYDNFSIFVRDNVWFCSAGYIRVYNTNENTCRIEPCAAI